MQNARATKRSGIGRREDTDHRINSTKLRHVQTTNYTYMRRIKLPSGNIEMEEGGEEEDARRDEEER